MIFPQMNKAFNAFNNTTGAQVVYKGDYDDYEGTFALITIGTLDGDLQPYSGKLAERDYGVVLECEKRFFTSCDLIQSYLYGGIKLGDTIRLGTGVKLNDGGHKTDLYALIGGRTFRIVYAPEYIMRPVVLLKEVEGIG